MTDLLTGGIFGPTGSTTYCVYLSQQPSKYSGWGRSVNRPPKRRDAWTVIREGPGPRETMSDGHSVRPTRSARVVDAAADGPSRPRSDSGVGPASHSGPRVSNASPRVIHVSATCQPRGTPRGRTDPGVGQNRDGTSSTTASPHAIITAPMEGLSDERARLHVHHQHRWLSPPPALKR